MIGQAAGVCDKYQHLTGVIPDQESHRLFGIVEHPEWYHHKGANPQWCAHRVALDHQQRGDPVQPQRLHCTGRRIGRHPTLDQLGNVAGVVLVLMGDEAAVQLLDLVVQRRLEPLDGDAALQQDAAVPFGHQVALPWELEAIGVKIKTAHLPRRGHLCLGSLSYGGLGGLYADLILGQMECLYWVDFWISSWR